MMILHSYISSAIVMMRDIFYRIISPPYCAYCKVFLSEREVFCDLCQAKVQKVVTIILPVASTKEVKVFAAAAYREPIKSLVIAKSWSDYIASRHLGELIWELTDLRYQNFDIVVPIPLHWIRFAKRGYNQAEEIARVIGQKSNKPLIHALKRIKKTAFQSALPSEQRMSNVADAFALNLEDKEFFKNKHILLVDDLMTTGSTLRAAAKQLYQLKPASITIAVACRIVQ